MLSSGHTSRNSAQPHVLVARSFRNGPRGFLTSQRSKPHQGWRRGWQDHVPRTSSLTTTEAEIAQAGDPPVLEAQPQPALSSASGEAFSWGRQWYAVAAVHNLDPSKPQPFELLHKQLVVWRDGEGAWRCLEDRCPHRAAPLSEGKVWADGTLACSYHGWRFDGSGACKAIPQASSAAAETTAMASRRACAVSHPTAVRQGMLFVWGEGGAKEEEESQRQHPPVCTLTEETEAQGNAMIEVLPHYTRDLPYDYANLVENLIDPAHLPWAHHGVMGNRDTVSFGKSDLRSAGELAAYYDNLGSMFNEVVISYHPPGLVKYTTKNKKGGQSCMTFWVTPTTPGRSRITMRLATDTPLPPLVSFILKARPAWLDHITIRSAVFDGDNVFLAGQERLLAQHAQQQGATWRNLFYMPCASDRLVAAARDWLDTKGGGGPFGSLTNPNSPAAKAAASALPAVAELRRGDGSRRHMLDRYHQHTVNCVSCMKALRVVSLLRSSAAAAAAVAWAACLLPLLGYVPVAAPVAATAAAPLSVAACATWLPALLAVGFTAAWLLLGRIRQKFLFEDYVHAER